MSEEQLPGVPHLWREGTPSAAPPSRRRLVLGLLLVLGVAAAGLVVALPYWRPPARCRFVPVVVGGQRGGAWPAPAWRQADIDSLQQGGYFSSTAAVPAGLDQATLVTVLRELRSRREPLVVYLCAPARTDAAGRVHLLPADADLADPATWLPLARVLELLREAKARHKLLILDLEPLRVAASEGLLLTDVAACVPADLELVPDGRRLVLTSCAAGQTPLSSEVMGRSAFGHYVEEGLRGQADADGDGRVSAAELAAYVGARVDRWARRVRGTRQTPQRHGEGDFIVSDLPGGVALPARELPEDRSYPDWLAKAWRQARSHQRDAVLAAERDWRDGGDPAAARREAEAALALAAPADAAAPPPRSLARALNGRTPPADLVDALREVVVRAEARTRGLPPPKADEARTQLATEFLKGAAKTPPAVVAAAALEAAVADARPATLEFLAAVVRQLEAQPRHVETLALVRLASSALPPPVIQRALRVVRDTERAAANPRAFPWVRDALESAAQSRHDALALLEARGYGPSSIAGGLLDKSEGECAVLLARQQVILDARAGLVAARGVLGAVGRTGHSGANWPAAADAARALADLLATRRAGDDLRDRTADLRGRLEAIAEPFTADGVRRLIAAGTRSQAGPAQWRDLDAALATPLVPAAERPAAWTAARDLARRLTDDVARLDRHDGPQLPEVPTIEDKPDLLKQARQAVALLSLTGRAPPPLPAKSDRGALAALERALRAAWRRPTAEPADAELWAWQADRFRYEAREQAGFGADTAAARFYADAAAEYRPWLPPGRERFASVVPASVAPRLLPDAPITQLLEVLGIGAEGQSPPVTLDVLTADEEWLTVTPTRQPLPAPGIRTGADGRSLVPVRIALKPGAGKGAAPAPLGVLARARLEGRSYHRPVPVPLTPRGPEVLFSVAEKLDASASPGLRLRAAAGQQPYRLFVRNPIDRGWTGLVVRLTVGDVQRDSAPFALGPGEARAVPFAAAPAPPAAPGAAAPPLPELTGPLRIQVVDGGGKGDVLTDALVPVRLAAPTEYVDVTDVRFDPSAGRNRLSVRLRLRQAVAGPPVTAELVLPPVAEGGMSFRDGTRRGKLPPSGAEITLFADGVQAEGEATFHLTIDGWARAFTFRTALAATGAATPRQVDSPAVRLRLAPVDLAGPRFAVPVEVDQAPAGARLEVSLGRLAGGDFRAEALSRFDTARQRRIGVAVGAALIFEASWRDWTAQLDTSQIRGPREVRVRLLDADDREIALAARPVVLAETAPQGVQFLSRPERAWRQVPLPLQARGGDAVAGVKAAFFFVGRPAAGKAPADVRKVPGTALDEARTRWGVKLPLPADRKGPTDISVEFVNAAGLSAFDTITVDLTETDPAATMPAKITGRVVEGERPQGGLKVVLSDDKGAEKGTADTRADGMFEFANLPAGKYRLSVTKPANGRRGLYPRSPGDVIDLRPGATVNAEVPLFIP